METQRKLTAFEKRCQEVADKMDVEVTFYRDKEPFQDPFEDDGNLHVISRGSRAAFSIGQDTPAAIHNEKTRAILTALGMEKKIGERVLVDETEEDDDCCPECGRPY